MTGYQPTDYEIAVGLILLGALLTGILGALLAPRSEPNATDPYSDEYPGVDAPREKR